MLSHPAGKLKIAANYRVSQPIENFKMRLKIVQQKSLLAELFETEGETRDSNYLEYEERNFAWQEKVFSPFEYNFYSDEKNCLTDLQKVYHERIVGKEQEESRLFTCVHEDSYCPDKSPLTGNYRSPLSVKNGAALPTVQNRKPFAERYNKKVVDSQPSETRIRSNHYLYKDQRSMHILADLSSKDDALGASKDSEVLLCTVTYDRTAKILTIDPDFTNDDCYTVETTGMGYDYWIEHVSQQQSLDDVQQQRDVIRHEVREKQVYKEAELFRELAVPPSNILRVFLNLDLSSARGFPHDALFLTYYIDMPKYWSTSDREKLSGRTQRCNMMKGVAQFSYVSEILLDFDMNCLRDESAQPSWPYLLISVASLDSWTRYRIEGYASLPLPPSPGRHSFELHTWRPVSGFVNALRRFFTGGTVELEDITYCAIPESHEGNKLDKTRLKIVPSGIIEISLNIVHESKTFTKNPSMHRDAFDRLSAGALMNNLDNVLEQFKAARERMILARAMNL